MKQILYALAIFVLVNIACAYFYEYPVYRAIQNKTHKNFLKWNDIHNNPNSYDLITIGASRTYTSFNPLIIDSSLHLKSYNMGTSAQDIAESYYTLKEIYNYQNPKFIILDLFFPSADDSHDYYQIFSNASFFNSKKLESELIIKGYGPEGLLNYCVPLVKFKDYIKQDIMRVLINKNIKQEDEWINGFLYDTVTLTKNDISKFTPISNFGNTSFDKERFAKYLHKIKTLTDEHHTKLICVRTPYPPSRLALSQIDEEGEYFRDFMKDLVTPYFDLNTYEIDKYKYVDQDFSDYHHPNYKGAQNASNQLVDIIKGMEMSN